MVVKVEVEAVVGERWGRWSWPGGRAVGERTCPGGEGRWARSVMRARGEGRVGVL